MPLIWDPAQSDMPAAHWHDGQITCKIPDRLQTSVKDKRRHDIRNLDIERMIELHIDGADLAILDVEKKAAQQRSLQMEQIGSSASSGNNVSAHCYRQSEKSPLILN